MPGRFTLAATALTVILCVVGAATYFYFLKPRQDGARAFALLSAEELSQYHPELDSFRSITMNAADGPNISVSSPQGFKLASPVDFVIDVTPRDGVPVNMGSLKIEYRLGPAWVNMTKRIMNYASITGSRLSAKGAELPKGNHALRVSIQDEQHRLTRATVKFSVSR